MIVVIIQLRTLTAEEARLATVEVMQTWFGITRAKATWLITVVSDDFCCTAFNNFDNVNTLQVPGTASGDVSAPG